MKKFITAVVSALLVAALAVSFAACAKQQRMQIVDVMLTGEQYCYAVNNDKTDALMDKINGVVEKLVGTKPYNPELDPTTDAEGVLYDYNGDGTEETVTLKTLYDAQQSGELGNIGEVENTWMDKNYGEIRNVTIAGGSFASTLINENQGGIHDVTFAGNSFVGALIDENNDKLDNITFMNLELYAPLIRVNKGDLNNIRLTGIEATIGGGDTAMFVAQSQEGSITNVVAEDIDLTVNSDMYSFGALIGSAWDTYLSQIGIRDSEITISSTCTSSCMAGLVGSLNSNLTESFAEDVTFRLSDLSISNSSVAGLVGSLTDPNVTVSNSYSYGLVFTGTWNGKISGLIGEAGSVHVDHLYSHVDKTASTVYLDDDIQFTGIYTIVNQDRDASADSVWYNAGFSTYTYSGSLFGGGASSISGTNLYGTEDFDIENGSKAIQMLGLDRAIWETLYGGRPVLSWAN